MNRTQIEVVLRELRGKEQFMRVHNTGTQFHRGQVAARIDVYEKLLTEGCDSSPVKNSQMYTAAKPRLHSKLDSFSDHFQWQLVNMIYASVNENSILNKSQVSVLDGMLESIKCGNFDNEHLGSLAALQIATWVNSCGIRED